MKKWLKWILIGLGIALLLALMGAAFVPLREDEVLPPEKYGAGASSVLPAYSGLQREFPPVNEPADNPASPEKVELGRLLFFDPILSHNDDMSCATCHHPDYGFADGLPLAIGAGGSGAGAERTGGTQLHRGAMSLWNVAYSTALFWDGRAPTLEDQMLVPMTHPDEMAATPEEIQAQLKDIPEYVTLFDKAFGGGADALTMENTQSAIAAFERTLVSDDSPFDRYAAGQFGALTPQQRRGLGLFRSAATRCFECHSAPTFGEDDYFVTGVPEGDLSHDSGRKTVAPDAQDGAFKAASLRNIALTAPYMHNGQFAMLEEVVDFYAKGGGRPDGVEGVDRHVTGFDLNDQEKADLIAFLYALTDESALPEIPDSVPSGLPVVEQLENPARETISQINVPVADASVSAAHVPGVVTVEADETIQGAVDRAGPGDTIQVPYGVYHERVVIDWSDIKLLGVPNHQGEWPVLEGDGVLSDGVIASGNNFEMGNFAVQNYTSNGVLVEGATGVYLHDMFIDTTGAYGVYPVRSTGVLIERIEATGVNDAAIYAGKSENVIIRDNQAYGNVVGIELENTVNGEVYGNHTHDNSLGILIDLLPGLPSKVSLNTKVYDNVSENNNGVNFAPPDSTVSLVRTGTGVLVVAADHVEVYNNTIRGNKTGGLAMFKLTIGFDEKEIDVGPDPDHNYVHDNTLENNGYDADPFIKDMLGQGFDIIWDGSGVDNRFDQPGVTSFPPRPPTSAWPAWLYNLYSRALNALLNAVG